MRRLDGISGRFFVASVAVAAITLAIVAVGVLRVGGEAFETLMMAAGASADHAREMFDQSITIVFALAAIVAAAVALAVAAALARRLGRPIERMADAASRIADGDLETRVPEEGPAELRALAVAYNTMAGRLVEQEAIRREFIVNASHELRTPLTNLQGYLEALRDGVIPPDPETFESLREEVDRLTRLAASLDVLAGAEERSDVAREIDVATIVMAAADLAAPAFARRSIELSLDVEPGLAPASGPTSWPRSSQTCSRTPCGTPRPAARWRCRPPASRRASTFGSPTPVRAYPVKTSLASGSGSTGSRSRATASTAARGSAWPSSSSSWRGPAGASA